MEIICEPFWTKRRIENFTEYEYFDGVGVRPVNRDDFWWGIYVLNNIFKNHLLVSGYLQKDTLIETNINKNKYHFHYY